ncbi:MAG: lamin tail domain-containing protein, partial [Ferruginibacter sp.]|nr:lamin tail domain-containing protein [Ferruginibacter sp.]
MGTVSAQVSLTLPNSSYAQDFNTLASSGTSSTLPAGWFFIETGTGSNALYTAGTGSGAGGDTYSFGASSSTERALGGLQSGSVVPAYGAAFTNNTGTDISSLVISYTGETWRVAAINRSDRIDFQYSTDATSLTTGTWIDDNVLDYANPGQATGSGSMQHSASLSNSLSINIPNGATIWIRWLDLNVSGSDDGIGIDDFNVSYNNVAPPAGSADIPQSFAIVNFGGPDVYYDLKASTANPDFDGAYLGTFASGGSIWLDGAQNKTEKCGTYDITGNRLYYRIYPTASPTGSYNNINLPWLSNDGGSGGCTDQTWQEAGAGINLLNGLCDGNYTVEVYTVADYTGGSGGTVLANNGGANYKANFSISNPVNSGIFESYAVVNGNFYDLQAATVNADFNGAGLGVYNSLTGSLVVNGGQNKTFKCPPDDITSGALYYRVYPAGSPSGSFTVVNFNWASNDPGALCTGGQNQTWQQTANSTPNLITGLPDGMYSLEIYTDANFNSACGSATHYSNNGGSNYIANFQVGTPPSLTNPGTQNVSAAAGCVAVVNYSATATGTAPIAYSFTFSGATSGSGSGTGSGSTFNLGTTNVSITASNSFGSDVQSFSVVVADNNVPTVITQNATVYLDASGNASITAAQIDNGSSDNCGVQSIAVAPSTFNCTNLAPNASDLLISEYVEGSSNNKAIEIYNGTGAAVNLQDYALRIFTNGASSPSNGIILPNFSLANGATYVIVNNGAGIITTYNLISATVINFNGDDALALVKNPTTTTTGGTFVDIFGRIGEDPGTAWVNLPNTTLDATLRRKSTVINGVNTNPGASFPTLLSEWEVFAQNNISGLGTHSISSVNTVTLTVTDIHGNVASGTANVNVVDNTVPTAPTIADATGECSVTVTAPSATDNCAGSVTGTTTDPTTYNAQGSYTITWTFDDGNGNTSTATQNVIVDDVTAPTAPTIADATGECSVTVTAPSATDNCAGSVTGTTTDPTTYNAQGSYT